MQWKNIINKHNKARMQTHQCMVFNMVGKPRLNSYSITMILKMDHSSCTSYLSPSQPTTEDEEISYNISYKNGSLSTKRFKKCELWIEMKD